MSRFEIARGARGGRLRRRRLLRLSLAGGVGAAFLVACSGDSDDGESSGTAGEGTVGSRARTAEAGQPKAGGALSVRIAVNPPLDPHTNSTFAAQALAGYVYARLLKFKTGADPAFANNYETEPDLAESVEIPGDGTTLTYRLRAGARFQDVAPVSGRVVDAEDVRFSLERFRTDQKSTNRGVFGSAERPLVESVETPDARTVVFKLAKPYGPFRSLTASSNYLWIMPREIATGQVDPARQAIGSGPFILESAQPDIAYKLRRNPTYYGAPMPYVDSASLTIIGEEAQEVAQFQAGRLEVAAIPAERVEEVQQSVPKAEIVEFMPASYGFLAFQLRGDTPFQDERVRRAAQMSIDRDALLALIYQDKGEWQSSIPANFGRWRVDPKSSEMGSGGRWFGHDPGEAKKLLAAAGHPNGLSARFIYTNNGYGERFNQTSEAIAGMLKEGGFNVQIVTQDYLREFITPGTGSVWGNFEGMLYSLQASFSDPHDYLYSMHHTKSTRNHGGVNDPQLEAMLDKEETTLDDNERVPLVHEIQRYLADKVYYGTTSVGPTFNGIQEWVRNYQRTNANGAGTETYAKVWLER